MPKEPKLVLNADEIAFMIYATAAIQPDDELYRFSDADKAIIYRMRSIVNALDSGNKYRIVLQPGSNF